MLKIRAGRLDKASEEKGENQVSIPLTDAEFANLKVLAGRVPLATYVKRRLKDDTDLFQYNLQTLTFAGDTRRAGTSTPRAVTPKNSKREPKRTQRTFFLQRKHSTTYDHIVLKMKGRMKGPALAEEAIEMLANCLLYTSPSPRDGLLSRMPSSA